MDIYEARENHVPRVVVMTTNIVIIGFEAKFFNFTKINNL